MKLEHLTRLSTQLEQGKNYLEEKTPCVCIKMGYIPRISRVTKPTISK